jgi:hypothetical protein
MAKGLDIIRKKVIEINGLLVKTTKAVIDSKRFLYSSQMITAYILFLVIIAIVVWKMDRSFFFWDEWDWLKRISDNNFPIFEPHNEHLLPIIKLFYFAQIKLSSANPLFFHYAMISLHVFVSFLFTYFLFLMLKRNLLAVIGGVMFLVHPFQWENVLWSFQSQIIINVGFVIIALILLKLFIDKGRVFYYLLSLIFTFLQFFCFGQGLIFPLVLLTFFTIFKKEKNKLIQYLPFFVIFVINIIIYLQVRSQNVNSYSGLFSTDNLLAITKFYLYSLVMNLSRSFTLIGSPSGLLKFSVSILVLVVLLIGLIYVFLKSGKKLRKRILFCIVFYLMTFIPISLGRYKMDKSIGLSFRYAYYFLIPVLLAVLSIIRRYLLYIGRSILIGVVILCIPFSLYVIYKARSYKYGVIARNEFNCTELKRYYDDRNYEPDFSRLHPDLTEDEILEITNNLGVLERILEDGC